MATTFEFPYASPGKDVTPAAFAGFSHVLLRHVLLQPWNKAEYESLQERIAAYIL